jgi:hypothetical protein
LYRCNTCELTPLSLLLLLPAGGATPLLPVAAGVLLLLPLLGAAGAKSPGAGEAAAAAPEGVGGCIGNCSDTSCCWGACCCWSGGLLTAAACWPCAAAASCATIGSEVVWGVLQQCFRYYGALTAAWVRAMLCPPREARGKTDGVLGSHISTSKACWS